MKSDHLTNPVIFTDLDGTLLDHETYRFDPAVRALERLERLNIPVVISSSKTLAEIIEFRTALGNKHPFVAENGSVIGVPQGYFGEPDMALFNRQVEGLMVQIYGRERALVVEELKKIRTRTGFQFSGFADWSDSDLAKVTGLNAHQASLANQRLCTEPILWQDSDTAWNEFDTFLKQCGLTAVQGGRFRSISEPYDKKDGIIELSRRFRNKANSQITMVGLGDSPNDQAMLDMMDIAVVVRSAKSDQISLSRPDTIIQTRKKGPEGWNESVSALIDTFIKPDDI